VKNDLTLGVSIRRHKRGSRTKKRRSPKGSRGIKGVETLRSEVVDALLVKLKGDPDAALSAEERRILAGVLESWAHVVERAQRNDLNIRELRKLLGIILERQKRSGSGGDGNSGEGGSSDGGGEGSTDSGPGASSDGSAQGEDPDVDESESSSSQSKDRRDEHGRRSSKDFPGAAICEHPHTELTIGSRCPGCGRGKLYRYNPSQYMTISGQPVFMATQHIVERLQCNLCDEVFKAPLSKSARLDGADGRTLYSYSAVALIAILKFFGVMPWHRMETVQSWIGVRVPDASMFDQCERLANAIAPVAKHLERLSSMVMLLFGDDTSACVLNERSAIIPERESGKLVERTGCHTTCVIAVTNDGHHLVHFRIGIQHTGELLDELLSERPSTLLPPMVMSDALSANKVTVCQVRECFCNAHTVRYFKDLRENYPKEAATRWSGTRRSSTMRSTAKNTSSLLSSGSPTIENTASTYSKRSAHTGTIFWRCAKRSSPIAISAEHTTTS
jgi:transposase